MSVAVNIHLKANSFSRTYGSDSGASLAASPFGSMNSLKRSNSFHNTAEDRLRNIADRLEAIEQALTASNGSSSNPTAGSGAKTAAASAKSASSDVKAKGAVTIPADPQDTAEVKQLKAFCGQQGLASVQFKWVPSDYYSRPLKWRRDTLGAPSIQYLCKSILLENTRCQYPDCSIPTNSRYYFAVFQYVERFDAEKVLRYVKALNEGMGKKQFNFRLADSEASAKLTGFTHNAVVPFGNATTIPIILSEKITHLSPPYFWLGGGHEDCKMRIDIEEFIETFKPFVADITNSIPEEELANITGY